MPSITDFKNTKRINKLFKKKEYRPWGTVGEKQSTTSSSKTIQSENNNSLYTEEIESKLQILPSTSSTDAELDKTWRCLYGAKKTLLEIIINNIEENCDSYVITSAITTNQLLLESALPVNTIKTSLQQLKHNLLISNYETKPGIGGFARYKISKDVYEYFIKKFSLNK
ncbi:MAG: hypothetical protein P8P83_05910 [Rickettsiaceae bacterium]|nr:hypothetical protein [Rickettsiaceae bacterium]